MGDRKRELSSTDTDSSFSSSPVVPKEKKDKKKLKMDTEKVDLNMILKSLNDMMRKQDELQKTLDNVATKDDIKQIRSDMDQMNKSLTHKIEILDRDVYELKRDRDALINRVEALNTEKGEIEGKLLSQKQKLSETEQNLNDLQQYTRNWSLRFFGCDGDGDSETAIDCIDKILTIVNEELNVEIDSKDIEVAHRTGRRPSRQERDGATAAESGAGGVGGAGVASGPGSVPPRGARTGTRPRPIIVRFYSRLTRDSVLAKRKLLKGKNVSIGEDLTPENFKCLKRVQEHSGTLSTWSHRGKILTKLKNGVVIQVTASCDIDKVIALGLQGRGRMN